MVERGDPCSEVQLAAAEEVLGVPLPAGLRQVYEDGDGRYNGKGEGEWWVVWPLDRVVTTTRDGWTAGNLSRGLLAFGDDGTGNPFCVPTSGEDEVLRWNWIDGDVEVSEGTLARFLSEWVPPQSA